MESYDIIANQPVVIDNGSGVIKAGFAGDQIPKYCFPNYVGRPKHMRVMAGALEGDLFIGPVLNTHTDTHRVMIGCMAGSPKLEHRN